MATKKVRKMRGHQNHGWGKHHRGKGNKGGCGNAGRGKRSDHKKRSYMHIKLGKYGFTSHAVSADYGINLKQVEDKLDTWIAQGLAEVKDGLVHVDLGKMGFTKLLGTGKLTRKLKISVPKASKKAQEKIAALGGAAE